MRNAKGRMSTLLGVCQNQKSEHRQQAAAGHRLPHCCEHRQQAAAGVRHTAAVLFCRCSGRERVRSLFLHAQQPPHSLHQLLLAAGALADL